MLEEERGIEALAAEWLDHDPQQLAPGERSPEIAPAAHALKAEAVVLLADRDLDMTIFKVCARRIGTAVACMFASPVVPRERASAQRRAV